MAFGANMRQKVGNVTKVGFFGTDVALQGNGSHYQNDTPSMDLRSEHPARRAGKQQLRYMDALENQKKALYSCLLGMIMKDRQRLKKRRRGRLFLQH
jgi:hypothetical protein